MRPIRLRTLTLPLFCASLALLSPSLGCVIEDQDSMDVPGDYLGTYDVEAILIDSTCGAGELSAPTLWDFEVMLSKEDGYLYWTNGSESIEGDLSDDETSFGFTTEVSTTLKESQTGRPGCVIWRQDIATGELTTGSDVDDVTSFTGKLTYNYAAGTGSECDEVLPEYGISQMPCTIRYDLTADRVDED